MSEYLCKFDKGAKVVEYQIQKRADRENAFDIVWRRNVPFNC